MEGETAQANGDTDRLRRDVEELRAAGGLEDRL
jgi:hypothetical protein